MGRIKIIIAEDHKIFREAIAKGINQMSNRIDVICTAENGIELLEAVKKNSPDVIVLDIYMPEMDGWKVLEILKSDYPSIKTVMFSGEFDLTTVSHAILAGAGAFIDKWKSDENNLVEAIESVYDYGYYFNDIVSQEIILTLKKQRKIPSLEQDQTLTERERDIINQICEGKPVKEIAASLNIAESTVKFHKTNVFKKTDSNSDVDVLKYAIWHGIYNVFQEKLRKKG